MSDDQDLISRSDLNKYVDDQVKCISERGLMYGGDLNGVEAVWVTLMFVRYHINNTPVNGWRGSYARIANKYDCGCAVISSKLAKEMGQTPEASIELVRRLMEVDDLFKKKLKEHA